MSAVGRLVGGAAVAGIAVFGGVTATGDDTTRDDSGEITEAGGLGVFSMQDGDCFIVPDEELVSSVEAVPCTDPHDGQKYADVTIVIEGEYTEDKVLEAAGEKCYEAFEGFVGVAYEQSELYFNAFTPTKEGWENFDREANCIIVPEEGTIDFDAQGSAR